MSFPIKCAAIKRGQKIWLGKCHADILLNMVAEGVASPKTPVLQEEQGFIDEAGEFLNRIDAYKRAVEFRQIEDIYQHETLFSEFLSQS